MSSKYYCTECLKNHEYSSTIGKKHLKYRKIILKRSTPRKTSNITIVSNHETQIQHPQTDTISKKQENIGRLETLEIQKEQSVEESSNSVLRFIRNYKENYYKGVEKFGFWWKVFHISIWSIVLIFILTASIAFTIFLPKIDMIRWILR